MSTVMVDGILVDAERGFDVLRGEQVEHFDTIAAARDFAERRGGTIRYWKAKEA